MATSMKRLFSMLGLLILVLSTQFSVGHCRVLRAMKETVVPAGCEDVQGAEQAPGMASFTVKNSITRPLVRSLAFRLASGPSKRGPGH